MGIFVCSDIHGNYKEWVQLIEESHMQLEKGDYFFILGDLIDRGPESKACVEYALTLTDQHPENVVYLMGNHEYMMLQFLQADPKQEADLLTFGERWTKNGGLATIESFLGHVPEGESLLHILTETQVLFWKQHKPLIHRLEQLPFYHITGDYVFVHAGFQTEIPLEKQDPHHMVWIREKFYENFQPAVDDILENKTIIHGHTPVQNFPTYRGKGFFHGGHHIGIDGGAAANKKIIMLHITDHNTITSAEFYFQP